MNHEFAFSGQDFTRVRGLIAAYAGISLHERKQNMVYNRLSRRLRATGLRSFREYLDWVERPGSEERERFVNALTTNLTSFFREPHHFDMLVALARKRPGVKLRVWSSACSTGEEAYSATIALREAHRNAEILASDVDTDALEAGRSAVYRVQALDSAGFERMAPHFLKGSGENAGLALVRPELRAMVRFLRHDIRRELYLGKFDAIFCCNVCLYFMRPTKDQILARLTAALRRGGYLFLGHAEGVNPPGDNFRAIHRPSGVVFQRIPA